MREKGYGLVAKMTSRHWTKLRTMAKEAESGCREREKVSGG